MTKTRSRTRLPRTTAIARGSALAVTATLALIGANFALVRSGDATQARPDPAPPLRLQNAGKPWSHRESGGVHRFEVRGGDGFEDEAKVKNRSEGYSPIKIPAGKPFVIDFDMKVEPGPRNAAAWMTLVQLQSTFDKGESGHSPPFAIEMTGERLRIVIRSDAKRISDYQTFAFKKLYSSDRDIVRGRWYRFRIAVTFDPFGNGALKVSRDGVGLVDYKGAIGFDDAAGAYFKAGVYRAADPGRFAASFRNLSIRPARD